MSPTENAFIRKAWIAILTAVAIVILTNIFSIPERISGMGSKIRDLEVTKMNKEAANEYFTNLQTLMASQCAKWDQYMLSNEKDKERILKEIEIIQEDIKKVIGSRTTTRSVTPQTQSTGGRVVK